MLIFLCANKRQDPMFFSFQTQFWTTQEPRELFVSGGEPSELWQVNSVDAPLTDSPTVDANSEELSVDVDEIKERVEMAAVAAPEAGTKVLTVRYDN